MCGDDGVEIPDESAPVIRADGAKGVYAPMNDIKPSANKRKQMSLDELFGDDDDGEAGKDAAEEFILKIHPLSASSPKIIHGVIEIVFKRSRASLAEAPSSLPTSAALHPDDR